MRKGNIRKGGIDTKERKSSFFSGVIILTAANLTVKLIGLIYKIPLTNMLGDEGMGYFNTAYQIYSWLYMLSTAGLPVAMSLLVSECNAKGRYAEKKRLLKLTFSVFGIIGFLGSILMAVFCRSLADFISADLSYLCILAVSPALFFVCISSTLRGYFQGHSDMLPTAISEIAEAVGKLAVGILLGAYALNSGLPIYKVAAYSILGISVGVAAGAILLTLAKLLGRDEAFSDGMRISAISLGAERPKNNKTLLLSLLRIAVPIMLSSSLLGMSSMLDTLIIIRRLKASGLTSAAAVSLYGNYTAYCVTLFNLPPVLIYPIVNALIPNVSALRAKGEYEIAEKASLSALKLAIIIALPCALGLAALAEPILKLIFNNTSGAEMAAPLLAFLSPSVFLIAVMAVLNGILQAYGLQKYTLISMLLGVIAKAVSAFILPTLTLNGAELRMLAAPISTFLFYLAVTVIDLYFLAKHTLLDISITRICLRPFTAAVICSICAVFTYNAVAAAWENRLAVLISIAVAAVVYLLALVFFGAISSSELEALPLSQKHKNYF